MELNNNEERFFRDFISNYYHDAPINFYDSTYNALCCVLDSDIEDLKKSLKQFMLGRTTLDDYSEFGYSLIEVSRIISEEDAPDIIWGAYLMYLNHQLESRGILYFLEHQHQSYVDLSLYEKNDEAMMVVYCDGLLYFRPVNDSNPDKVVLIETWRILVNHPELIIFAVACLEGVYTENVVIVSDMNGIHIYNEE